MKQLMCDPPSGWRHGFPKAVPNEYRDESTGVVDPAKWTEFKKWIESHGCKSDSYIRFWLEDKE